jgi:hypothetical protein
VHPTFKPQFEEDCLRLNKRRQPVRNAVNTNGLVQASLHFNGYSSAATQPASQPTQEDFDNSVMV